MKLLKFNKKRLWSRRASIPLPLACKASALPFELRPLRGHPGLNRGPIGLQPIALPLSYTPQISYDPYLTIIVI